MRRAVPVAVAALAAVGLTACSGGGHPAASSSAPVVARWWSNAAAVAGSTVNPHDPAAAAASLQPSQHDYCSMLSQTLAASGSLIPNGSLSVPVDTLQAFTAELQRVAPSSVSASWQVLGPALVSYVRTSGASLGSQSSTAVTTAVTTIAADAKANCHVDLSKAAAPVSRPTR